jgi:lipoprotein-releasing system permease protein
MNFLFAYRYFKSKKTTNAINIISWVSVIAIAVVSASLVIVMSVFNGFEGLVKNLYSDFYADAKILPATGKKMVATQYQLNSLAKIKAVINYSCIVEEKAVVVNNDYQTIVVLKAVDDRFDKVSSLNNKNYIIRGNFSLGNAINPNIVVGAGIENALGVDVEMALSPLTIYMPSKNFNGNINSLESFNSYKIVPKGTFLVQQEFDNKYAFTNIAFAKYMLDFSNDECSYIEIKTQNNQNVKQLKAAIAKVFGNNVIVETLYEQNKSLYNIMQSERWIIFALLALILFIASFNIVGALTMLVLEKQKDIHILKAMGLVNFAIKKIFITLGILIAATGTTIGILFGVTICWLQIKYKFLKLQGGTFIIDYYPVDIHVFDIIICIATIFFIAIIASWIPAKKAANQILNLKS